MASNITKISDSTLEARKARPMSVAVAQTALVVLGMHRSGTSATTRVMSLLGADLPANLMLPKEGNNEAGFWESLESFALNDEILASGGSSWDDWRQFNTDWMRSPLLQAFKTRALQILEREFSRSPLFVLKDPRMCRLMPFWSKVFREFGADVKCVLPLRNPLEVAASLKKRDGFSPARSYMLWLRHVLDAEKASRKLPRVFVAYDDLLEDWRGTVSRLSDQLELGWPRQSAVAELEIDKFLDERYRHHRIDQASIDSRPEVAGWVRVTSKALAKLLMDPYAKKALKRLDAVREEFDRASDALGAVLLAEELARSDAEQQKAGFEAQLVEAKAQLDQRNSEVDEFEQVAARLRVTSQNLESEVSSLSASVSERDGRISHFEEHVAEQLALIHELSGKVSERDQRIQGLEGNVKGLTGETGRLREALESRVERLTQFELQAREQAGVIDELRTTVEARDEQVAGLAEQAREQAGVIGELRTTVEARDEQVAGLAEQAREQAGVIDELRTTVEARDEQVAGLAGQAREQAGVIDELRTTVEARDEQVAGLAEQAREQAGVIGELRTTVEARDEQVAGLAEQLVKQGELVKSLQTALADREARIGQLEAKGIEQVGVIDRLNEILAARDSRIDELQRKRSVLETAVERTAADLRASVSRADDLQLSVATLTSEIEGYQHTESLLHARKMTLSDERNRALARLNALQTTEAPWFTRLGHFKAAGATSQEGSRRGLPPRSYCGRDLSLRQRRAMRRQADLILQHGLFDVSWYVENNPEVVLDGLDPLWHWLLIGCTEGRDPHPLFDTEWYLARYPDVAKSALNPLEHYLRFGATECRDPHPLFDAGWYLISNHLSADAGINPLVHYLREGANGTRDPHPLFDTAWYLKRNPDVAAAGVDPLVHYIRHGAGEGRDPHPLFQADWYLKRNPDIFRSQLNPLAHFVRYGWAEHRDPNPLFDTEWYLEENPDVADAGLNPLVHFLKHGAEEGRDPNPFFDTDWYLAHNPDLKAGNTNVLVHYLRHGGLERRDPGPLFNTEFYLKRHPEAIESRVNPLVHFLANGGDPSDLREVWSDYSALRGAGEFLMAENKQAQFQPSERFIVEPESFNPKVTVVLPNYNHAPYLRQRLDCVYAQTYRNFHVILLDDCSGDDSREILLEYRDLYPERTTILFNEKNSGGVFHQWRRGIENADSELIWIAESDDYCDENFLSELVPYFMDEAISLAYSRSVFVDENGRPSDFAFENYLSELSADRWKANYVATAHHEVAQYLGRKNTIPNVSSAVFRKPDLTPLLQDGQWLSMKICGDWIFYLHLLKGGKIAFSVDTNNYFRFHSANSSAKTYSKPTYYKEHEAVASDIARHYCVPDETLEANRYYVERFFNENAVDLIASGVRFIDVFDGKRVTDAKIERKPNLLMAAFALATGGGEVFPIRLANHFKKKGYAVTFFNFMGDTFNPAMRRMLRGDIPLIERNEWCPDVDMMLEQFGIEVMHTHHASVDVYLGAHHSGGNVTAKHVVTMHGMYEAMSEEIFDLTLSKIAGEVSAWVYIADKNLRPFNDRKIKVSGAFEKIGNGMDPPTIVSLDRADFGVPKDAFLVCLASRAIPQKGWEKAVEIIALAREDAGIDIHLLLLGDGPVYDEMKLRDQPQFVHLLGFRDNVVDFYALSDLGLLPTTFEGESFPLSIIECFMAGRPMLVSDVGEVRNMLSDQSGRMAGSLIDLSGGEVDSIAVASELAKLARHDDYYIARQQLAAQLAGRFEFGSVANAYERVYAGSLRQEPHVEH